MTLTKLLPYAGLLIIVLVLGAVGYKIGQRSRNDEVSELVQNLSAQGKTVEVYQGLYSSKVIELKSVLALLDTSQKEVATLKKHLEDSGAKLLTTQQLVVKLKKAYEGALAANQVEQPVDPENPAVIRKKVEFAGELGPMGVRGFTITDPPEAFLKIEQIRPLVLSVSVAQNKDKTWSSFVTSSDNDVQVDIVLAGVNPLLLSPKWYQRIWGEVGASVLGDPAGSVGLRYTGDRYSIGVSCYATNTSAGGCGGSIGFRLFK